MHDVTSQYGIVQYSIIMLCVEASARIVALRRDSVWGISRARILIVFSAIGLQPDVDVACSKSRPWNLQKETIKYENGRIGAS